MLLGLAVLARRFHVGPRSNQTVLSQIMALAVGRHWAYYIVSLSITVVLALAANTSFGGLPILTSLLARDNYLPHLFSLRGDRQVFSNGILVLSGLSAALLVTVSGNTIALIPLFAIGVFTGFTLSQTGLVVHWWRTRPPRWRARATLNAFGAVVTAVATVIFLMTKFAAGAWVVVVAIPTFVLLFTRIHRYYDRAAQEIGLGSRPPPPERRHTLVVVPVTGVSRLTQSAISEALSIGEEVIAVSVVIDDGDLGEEADRRLGIEWRDWDPGVELVILHTEYSSVVEPLVAYIDQLREADDRQIVVLIPVIVPRRLRHRVLHNHIDAALSTALKRRTDVVVARVAMLLEEPAPGQPQPESGPMECPEALEPSGSSAEGPL